MMLKTRAAFILCVAAACAKSAPAPEEPAAASSGSGEGRDPAAYAAVADVFAHKRPIVRQCYGFAIENKEIADNQRVRVRLGLRVLPSGQPQDVHVVEATQRSKTLEDCLVSTVSKWTLPGSSQPLDFLYTYEFSNT